MKKQKAEQKAVSTSFTTSEPLEAIHLVALGIDAVAKRGTPEHAKALKLSEDAIEIWRKQHNSKKTCRHCGAEL